MACSCCVFLLKLSSVLFSVVQTGCCFDLCVCICIDSDWAVMEIVCDVLSSGLCNAEQCDAKLTERWSPSAASSLSPPSPPLRYAQCHTAT